MPPAKRNHDDSKADAPTSKEKNGAISSAKMRRITSQQGGSQLREVTNASTTAAVAPPAEPVAPSIQWSKFDRGMLHAYRREHNISTPSCFTSTFHQTVLARSGSIGAYSPTMQRRKNKRQNKEQLTRVIRKHFNGLGIQENDVIVDFIFKVRSDGAAKAIGPQKLSIITE